jgi:PAS domain S-box-containing protein
MAEKEHCPNAADDLRLRAEALVRKAVPVQENLDAMSPEAARQAVHELRVHQVELEMQNEELRRAQAELESSRARYFELYDLAPVAYLTLSQQGLILEANLTAATMLGVSRGDLARRPLSHFIFPEDQDIYYRYRRQLQKTAAPQVCEMRMLRAGIAPFWARMETTSSQDSDGAPVCRSVVSDISQGKCAEELLKTVNDELEHRVAERTAELAQRAEQLRALAAELTQAELRERHRLARVLHDELQQLLVGTRVKVGLLRRRAEDEQLLPMIAEIDDLLNQSIAESRSLATQLCPLVLYNRGLAAGLEWLGRQTQEKYHLAVEVEADPAVEIAEESTREFLFRAAGELLLNAAKHAQAHRVCIRMSQTEQQAWIEVRDDGVGFDPAKPAEKDERGGLGMFTIRRRLEVFGGQIDVVSSPGQGTHVRIRVPLDERQVPASPISE